MGFPYWLDFDRPVFPQLEQDCTADAVVIGAGIAGLKLARCLSRYGLEVIILEGARVGEGASSRNQGSINHSPSLSYRDCVQRHSRPVAQTLWRLGLENQRLLEAQIEEYAIECDYEVAGMTFLVRSDIEGADERTADYRADYELLREDGFQIDWLDSQEARTAGGSPLYTAGLRYPSDAQFHSGRFVVGLAVGVARSPQVKIFEGCRVQSIQRQGITTRVATSAGAVSAPVVFLATNALVPQVVPSLTRALRAERGQVFVTEPLPWQPCRGSFGTSLAWWREIREPDGRFRLLFGGGRTREEPDSLFPQFGPDADVCEAIDFCEYYAAGAIAMEQPQGVDVPGEENRFEYVPRGVTAVIAPWNFPLAILAGMTTAALATGNTVVIKASEQSTVIAAKLMEVFQELALPAGVLNYLPGHGSVAGAALVDHPDVATIAFTGSRAVGLAINARAAQLSTSGLKSVKHVIAEMGGKNGIIVDADADLDEAVLGVLRSAFGYQGQKCSACSRAILLESVYDTFLARLVEATRSLTVGPAEDPATSVGPVIDQESFDRIHGYIELGRKLAREVLAIDVGKLADEGFYIGPHIFADVTPDSPLAQEEIFGPVLAVIKAKDLDQAFEIFNGTDYALTGGIYSRSPANLQRARRELLVGNLYLNRTITGALVGRQPFGGFKMSGIGTKAGGPDYLLQFVLPRTITENTMRRGFAPSQE